MRDFNKVSGKFWMSPFAKSLKQWGAEAMLLSIYLQTNHHTHSVGVFYLPIHYIAHDTGIPIQQVQTLLKVLCKANFCRYDFTEEYIWLINYALEQAGGPLKEGDNRIIQAQKYCEGLPQLDFLDEFYQTNKDDFHLVQCQKKQIITPLEAPSKGLLSSETETKTKTETKTERETETESIVAEPRQLEPSKPEQSVFEHWKQTMNHPNAKFDNKRKRLISQAMKLGYDQEQLCNAITGCAQTPHNIGVNENGQ